jgi:hypothetical protein
VVLADWLRCIQEVPVCTCLQECIIVRRAWVPSGPTTPSSAEWLKDVRPCCLGTQIISFVSMCNHSWGVSVSEVCIMWQRCQLCDTLPGDSESHGFSCILHFTLDRLLATDVAREEHRDRLWRSRNFVFSQVWGKVVGAWRQPLVSGANTKNMLSPMLLLWLVHLWHDA